MESRSPSKFTGQRVHFIGIGGSGMSGLARMLLDNGAVVSGSEPTPNATSMALTKRGVKISRDQMGQLLSRETNLVVRTAAVPDGNVEFQAARALGIPTIKYAELLGEVMAVVVDDDRAIVAAFFGHPPVDTDELADGVGGFLGLRTASDRDSNSRRGVVQVMPAGDG